jgi:hypothetical protein
LERLVFYQRHTNLFMTMTTLYSCESSVCSSQKAIVHKRHFCLDLKSEDLIASFISRHHSQLIARTPARRPSLYCRKNHLSDKIIG